jgi:hypothetical protein
VKKLFLFLVFLLFSLTVNAWQIVGNQPPSTHTLEPGTFTPYESVGGAKRYLEIVESSACNTNPVLVSPSTTYTIAQGGLFKYYKSPTGTRKPWPVSYAQECAIPESEEPNNPPPQEVNFVGLSRVSINPTPTDPNDCTFHEWVVTAKNIDGTYMLQSKRLYDASIVVDGKRKCPYQ